MDLNGYLAKEGFALTGEFREVRHTEFYLTGDIERWEGKSSSYGKYLILRKLEEGEEPTRANLFTDLYIDIAEAGYELTGEYRRARKGEAFWDGARVRTDAAWIAALADAGAGETYFKYLILKKLKRFFEFDGQKFEVPEGYEFERVGFPRATDVGKYLASTTTNIKVKITELNWMDYNPFTYFIFTKKETN